MNSRLPTKTPLSPIVWTLLAVSVLAIMQAGLVSPSLPAIRDALDPTSDSTLNARLVLVAPAIVVIICGPIVGALADRTGGTVILVAGLVVYALCGIATFLVVSIEQLIALRFILGPAIAISSVMTATLVGAYFDGRDRDNILGWIAVLAGVGSAVFPLTGGFLATFGWRYAFLPYLLCLALIPAVLSLPPVPPRKPNEASAGSFPYAAVLPICAVAFVGLLILYLLSIQIAFHLRDLGIVSPSVAGLALATPAVTAAVASMFYRRIREQLGHPGVAAMTFLTMGLGYGLIGIFAPGVVFAFGLMLAGVGFAFIIPNCTAWLLGRVQATERGRASGALWTAIFLGQFVSPFVYEPLVARLGSSGAFLTVAGAGLIFAALLALHALARSR